MVLLGNLQINGSAAQRNPIFLYDTFTDIGSLKYSRSGTLKILEHYSYPGFSFSKAYIKSRFDLAVKYASQVDGLVFLLQEEIYKPSRTPQVSSASANGSSYTLEGVTIPAMPGNEDGYFVALLTAWKRLCIRLGKKAVLLGSPAVCSDDGVWPYMYGSQGISYIAANFDMIYLYHFPVTLSQAQGAICTQMNKNPGKNDAASYIRYWKGKGFRGLINYILVTKFSDFPGSTDINVIRADFKSAADSGADIISTYPYANGVYSNTDAVKRILDIYAWYGGSPTPIPESWECEGPPLTGYEISNKGNRRLSPACSPGQVPSGSVTLALFGDSHTADFSNGVTELIKDLNAAVQQSPTGKIDVIFSLGDMETVTKWDKAHKDSITKNIPVYFVIGNHDIKDVSQIKSLMASKYPFHPGPSGTEKTSFSLDIEDFHVVILNVYWDGKTNEAWVGGGASGGEIGPKLLAWLKADIAAAKTRYKIVLAHEPMYPDRRHVGNSLDWNKSSRDALQKILNDSGVDAFFSGHTHFARGDLIGNVLQVQAGVSGAKAGDNGDAFASMWFVDILSNGDLRITWKHDNSNSWGSPSVKTWTLSQGQIPGPVGKPILTSITPTSAAVGFYPEVIVTGSNFDSGAFPEFYRNSVFVGHGGDHIRTPTKIIFNSNFKVAETLTLRMRNGDGQLSDNIIPFVVSPSDQVGPIEFGPGNLAKIGLALAFVYAFIEKMRK